MAEKELIGGTSSQGLSQGFMQQILPPPSKQQALKPGWKTSEFWVVILSMIATDSATLAHMLEPKWAAMVMAVGGLAYAISRGLAKK